MITLFAALLLLLGVLMIILPGPAMVIIPLALLLLNTQYPDKVRLYIRKFQRLLSRSANWLDKKINQWR